ncbi:MAG: hypothetical protein AB7U75_14725 [Hyphomicrobiaceae bacterium]
MTIIKAGTILTIETGEYSDFTYHGPFRVLVDLDKEGVAAEYAEHRPDKYTNWPDRPLSNHNFVPFLIKKGYIEDIDEHESWHIGSYGEFKPQ